MKTKPDNLFNQRQVEGIDRTETARLTDQLAWFSTQNLYPKQPGQLSIRPGTACLVVGQSGTQIIQPATAASNATAAASGFSEASAVPGEVKPSTTPAGIAKVADFTALASVTLPLAAVGSGAVQSFVGVRQIRPGSVSIGFKR